MKRLDKKKKKEREEGGQSKEFIQQAFRSNAESMSNMFVRRLNYAMKTSLKRRHTKFSILQSVLQNSAPSVTKKKEYNK